MTSIQTSTPTSTIVKRTWQLGFAMCISRLLGTVTSFTGTWMMASLGLTTLAATALVTSTQLTLVLMVMGLLLSISVVIGRAFGAKQYGEIGAIMQQGWVLATLSAIPIIVICWFVKPILLALGQSPALAQLDSEYFRGYALGVLPTFWILATQQLLLAVKQQRFVVIMSLVGLLVSIAVGYVLIHGIGAWQGLGMRGMGYAYAVQAWISIGIYLAYCRWNAAFAQFALFRIRLRQHWAVLAQLFKIGWPIALQMGSDLLSLSAVMVMVGWLGEMELGVQQIATQYFILLVVPVFALSGAVGILIGQARGAKQWADVRRYGHVAMLMGVAFSAVVMLIFVLGPRPLLMLYLGHNEPSPAMVHLTVIVLTLTGVRLIIDALAEILMGALRGLFDTRTPMVISVVVTWLCGIPLSYVLSFPLHMGLVGITLGSVVAVLVLTLVLFARWWVMTRYTAGFHGAPN